MQAEFGISQPAVSQHLEVLRDSGFATVRPDGARRLYVGERRIPAGVGRAIRLRREFAAAIEDVWDALTSPERIGRWFLLISGDSRLGGRYQFEGNAGGEILACERPNRLKVTWAYGEMASDVDVSELEVRLSTVDGGARLWAIPANGGAAVDVLPDMSVLDYDVRAPLS